MRNGVLAVALGVSLAACGSAAQPSPSPSATAMTISGTYVASGASAGLSVVQALTSGFTKAHPSVVFEVKTVDTESSVVLVSAGDSDLGFIGRDLRPEEQGKVATVLIGASGTAVAVNAANPVKDLTKQQVADIFSGRITNWKDVGGDAGPIKVFVRESGSSTRATFESYFFGGKPTYSKDVLEVTESDNTVKAIAGFKGGIGMVTLNQKSLDDRTIRLPSVNGTPATLESLRADRWPIRRPTNLVYGVDESRLKPAIKAFLDWMKGPEGQKIIASF